MTSPLPRNLRAAREAAGLSREQLGVMAGASGSTVYRIESGNGLPTLDRLEKIAAVLGTTAAALLDDSQPAAEPTEAAS